jgi:hypothetical protein
MFSAGFEPGIAAIDQLETYALDRTATQYFIVGILLQ